MLILKCTYLFCHEITYTFSCTLSICPVYSEMNCLHYSHDDNHFYTAFFTILQAVAVAIACLNASSALHGQLLRSMLRAPMSFFDTTPLGRILNRFSKDMDTIDVKMPDSILFFLTTFTSVFTTLIIISYSSPLFLIAALPIGLIYYFVQVICFNNKVTYNILIILISAISAHKNRVISLSKILRIVNCIYRHNWLP